MNGEISATIKSELPRGLRRYKDDWSKSQKAQHFANALDSKVSELFHGMVHELRGALDNESEPKMEQAAIVSPCPAAA